MLDLTYENSMAKYLLASSSLCWGRGGVALDSVSDSQWQSPLIFTLNDIQPPIAGWMPSNSKIAQFG